MQRELPPQVLAYPDYRTVWWILEEKSGVMVHKCGTLGNAQRIASDLSKRDKESKYIVLEAKYIVGIMK